MHEVTGQLMLLTKRLARHRPSPPSLGEDRIDQAGLAVLAAVTEQYPIRPSDLSVRMGLDLSTISRQVKSLVEIGLLDRAADPDDGRASLVAPTGRGRRVITEIRAERRALLEAALSSWSAAEQGQLTALIDRLLTDLEGVGLALPARPPSRPTTVHPESPMELMR